MLIVNTMCKLLAAMLAGYFLGKRDVLSKEVNGKISSLIVQVTCPCLIISSIAAADGIDRGEVFFLLGTGCLLYVLGPVFAAVLVRGLRLPKGSRGVYQCMLIFSNCIFIGLPVCQSFFGDKAVFYVSVLHLPYNLLFFSYGIWLLAADSGEQMKFSPRQLANAGIVSAVVALVLFLGNIRLPEFINGSLGFVGSVTTPLSMMVIGSSIAVYSLGEVFKDKSLYLVSIVRLMVIPVLVYVLMSLITDNLLIVQLVTVTMGMPAGSMVVMGASEYHGDVRTASFGVAMTTLCSVITIPLTALILGIA